MTGRAPARPGAPPWRGSVSLGPSSNVLPDRAVAAPAADRGLSPSSQYGSSPGARKVCSSFLIAAKTASPKSIFADPRNTDSGFLAVARPRNDGLFQLDPGALGDLAPFLRIGRNQRRKVLSRSAGRLVANRRIELAHGLRLDCAIDGGVRPRHARGRDHARPGRRRIA